MFTGLVYTKEDCIRDLKRFYDTEGRVPVPADLSNNPKYISFMTIKRKFNSWSEALKLAGLKSALRPYNMSDEELKIWLEEQAIKNENGCWIWQGRKHPTGYGCIKYNYKEFLVHRLAYQLWFEDPKPLLVCHKCDVRACYNPDHLFLGTHSENNEDMIKKGRIAKTLRKHKKKPYNLSEDELFIWIRDEGTIKNDNKCWIFHSLTKEGYGSFGFKGKKMLVHRWMYEYINNQSVPMVGHKCNNKACCNPDHLYETNPRQNAIDSLTYHKGVKIKPYEQEYILEQISLINKSVGGEQAKVVKKLAQKFNAPRATIYDIIYRNR